MIIMRKILSLILITVFAYSLSFATIRRVGSTGTTPGVDYPSLQIAHDASNATGDTIYMYPGSFMACSVSKKLVIMAPGYFLDPADPNYPGNGGLQIFTSGTSTYNNVPFFELLPGSEGSEFFGCNFELGAGFQNTSAVTFNGVSGSILFKRCRFKVNSSATSAIGFNSSCDQISFDQCVIDGAWTIGSNLSVTNLQIGNCIILTNSNTILAFNRPGTSIAGIIQNCIFETPGSQSDFGNGSWVIENCISQSNGFTGGNITYAYNIGTATQFPIGNGNQQNISWNTIFKLTGSWDGKYMLATGSPALAAGFGGIDCGIFGGSNPYHLSGIPPFPTIYSLSSPQGPIPLGNTIQIDVSTRTNN